VSTVLVILHVLVCLILIAVVLLQRGRGAEIGAVFGGGGSSTVFGSRGAGNFLTKLTTGSAVVFMLTSLTLSYVWTQAAEDRLFDEGVLEEQAEPPAEDTKSVFEEIETVPATPETPPATPAPAPTPSAGGQQALPPLSPAPGGEPAP
jgi:preprotein translocase subunit SecG